MFRRQAFVATSERIIGANGARITPVAGTFHDPRMLLRLADEHCLSDQREVTIVVTHDFHGERAIEWPAGDGWTCITSTDVDTTAAGFPVWSTWTRGGHNPDTADRAVHIGILPHIDADRTPLFWPEEDPGTVAARLGTYHALTGAAWRGTAGMVGCAMLRQRYPLRQPLWFTQSEIPRGAGDLYWSRPITDAEAQLGYVHAFDLNGQYLTAAGTAWLPWTGLRPCGVRPFDGALAGMWQVDASTVSKTALFGAHGRPPLLNGAHVDNDNRLWISTPVMVLLHQLARPPRVVEALLAGSAKQVLRSWAETLRDARDEAQFLRDTRLAGAVKRTVNETVGLIGKPGGRIYRPEWRTTIVDLARANLYRRINHVHERAHLWPLAVRTDCLWYASTTSDPKAAAEGLGLRIGTQLGEWKVVDSMPAGDYSPDVINPRKSKRGRAEDATVG